MKVIFAIIAALFAAAVGRFTRRHGRTSRLRWLCRFLPAEAPMRLLARCQYSCRSNWAGR